MTNPMIAFFEKLFKIQEHHSKVRTEVVAGITTFLTMSYIIVVNPTILAHTGMSFSGVLLATVLVAAISSIAMGLYANLPYSLAPGMGINAFFTYDLVIGMGMRWETALGAVFISGIVFIVLTLTGLRTTIIKAMPPSLRYGTGAGIGIFLSLIGLINAGFIVSDQVTVVGFGGISLKTALFVIGLIITAVLVIRKVRGALMTGIVFTSLLALLVSIGDRDTAVASGILVSIPERFFALPGLEVFLELDIVGTLTISMIMPVFSLFFVDLFDSIGTFMGVAEAADMIEEDGMPKNVGKALLVDAFSTTISGLCGASAGTAYVESAAGIEEGGRTGLTAVVAGLLFLPFMFLSPLLALIPAVATAPVLVIVGVFMMAPLSEIRWKDFEEAVPAFLSLVLIPLTYSITQGVIWGFLSYTMIKALTGKTRQIHWMVYFIDAFAILSLSAPYLQGRAG
jgi:adenine/guanine/hypoxanthine permease